MVSAHHQTGTLWMRVHIAVILSLLCCGVCVLALVTTTTPHIPLPRIRGAAVLYLLTFAAITVQWMIAGKCTLTAMEKRH